jgi:hypothetical protein
VPFLTPDGGLTEKGWAAPAAFPIIPTLNDKQRHQVGFGMIPPTMNLIFTPDMLCYGADLSAGTDQPHRRRRVVYRGGLVRAAIDGGTA